MKKIKTKILIKFHFLKYNFFFILTEKCINNTVLIIKKSKKKTKIKKNPKRMIMSYINIIPYIKYIHL